MKIKIAGPSPLEANAVEVDGGVITIQPIPIKGHNSLKIAHLTALGMNGREAKAVVFFNVNTGRFSLQNHDTNVVFEFDKPADALANASTETAKAKGSVNNG